MPRTPGGPRLVLVLLAVAAACAIARAAGRAQSSSEPALPRNLRALYPAKWEYRTIHANKLELEGHLKEFGAAAWELVTVVKDPDDRLYVAYLKRPVFPPAEEVAGRP